ncbi:Protein lysine acetyltransferase Pat [bioreactor metagenome]|jgi:acetyltransferase|uniref:Protein lysine acetyltransferase Pat n=1 Tax=bioreactor metagenome TaxID=1076179 RepID=A0A644V1P3_9ZZZZ|nr:acetate--CoA ligase family protein [Bacteroidales bacterium]MBP9584422.1 acetate--CoA ligase family protein [Bacteroidales bacterium]MBP9977883.1 acetate--CoA ligase family protein [Bacteroidales bacterium]WRQ33283.1 acetate--CoA ligase family protein [Bacteroidales bacterium MB20-C3-3]
MITKELLSPKSIVVVGGSDDTKKTGGSALRNLINTGYSGKLMVVNPKASTVQGVTSFKTLEELPQVDLAILAIPAQACPQTVDYLCSNKGCKAVIIYSAGFHEDSEEGAILERKIVESVKQAGASLIGPNCIGVLTPDYAGLFTQPIPELSKDGVDIISGSGATVVFILEAAMQMGLKFSSVFSVGNSAQIGVEDLLKHLDETYIHGISAPVKLLYIENISKPDLLLKHSKSLISKGARIAAVKSGSSEAGSRAASSHTGAMASPDVAVSALFNKAGIIRCNSRSELVTVGSILMYPRPKGKRVAIITHAGGPAVMLTDILSSNGLEIPSFSGAKAELLLSQLYPGSSVANPIDFLATGTADQLSAIIDSCQTDFDVDSMAVIFGSPGLTSVYDVYNILLEKIKTSAKPIYPILPSIVNVKEEIAQFQEKGGISFSDEVTFGSALAKVLAVDLPESEIELPPVDHKLIRKIINNSSNGYLSPYDVQKLLDAAGIERAKEAVADNQNNLRKYAREIGYPLVMKVIGPVHKSDVGGVALNITDDETLVSEFNRMMKIPDTTSVLLQPMLTGTQLFAGAKREDDYGHIIMCGLGGIFVEALGDITSRLAPVSNREANDMITSLKGYKIIKGTRGQDGVNETIYRDAIRRLSALCVAAPEIFEMDINPLLGNSRQVIAVDARIRIEK